MPRPDCYQLPLRYWLECLHRNNRTASQQSIESQQSVAQITTAQLDNAITAALQFWENAGLNAAQSEALRSVEFTIADLDAENALGLAGSSHIKIDDHGAGLGWHVAASSQVADDQYELYTVVAHEVGHVLGLGDLDPNLSQDELMTGRINPGERHTSASDELFNRLAQTTQVNWLER